ncbi:MAG: glycosyltransferase family 87 protein, partial [Myxococcota bacterium]
ETLYRESDLPMPFKYPPPAAVLIAPLSVFPRALGGAVWNALSALCIAFSLWRWGAKPHHAAVAFLASFQTLFLLMDHGQVDGFILALVSLTVSELERRPALAGALWGVACLLKPPAGLLLFPLLAEKRWRVLGGAIGVGAVATALFGVRYGLGGAFDEIQAWRSLLSVATEQWYLRHDAQGLPSFVLTLWLGANAASPPIPSSFEMSAALAVSLAAFCSAVWLATPPGRARYAAFILGIALLSPQGWRANYVVALPLLILLMERWDLEGRPWFSGTTVAVAAVFLVQAVFGEGTLPDRLLDPTLAQWRPFALAYAALLLAFLSPSSAKSSLGSAMSRAPRR